jgi:hypothetical protein
MPADPTARNSPRKPFAVAVLRIGSHPLVYAVTFIIVVGALVFFLAIVPLVRMLQSGGAASVADAEGRNRVAQNTLDGEKKLANSLAAISSDDQALLAYALPSEPDEPGLAIILRSLAAKSGVKMSSFDISPQAASGTTPATVGQVSITMSLDLVSYDRLKLVLTNIEDSLRIFDLENYAYSPASGSVSINFVTYYLNNV